MAKLTTRGGGNPAPVSAELFGSYLRELRRRAGLTQQALAAACGVQRNSMNMIEMGRRFPSSGLLKKICDTVAPGDSIARTRLLFALINETPSALPEGIPPTHGKAAATDDLTLERVHAWLKARASQLERHLQEFSFTATGADRVIAPLFAEIDNTCARLKAAEGVATHLREIRLLTVAFDSRREAVTPPTHGQRTTSTPTASNSAPHNRERWRKRPPSKQECDNLRMELLRARAAGPEALARTKREIVERHGLSPKTVAVLLNTCTGKRYALNFAARVVSRAPQVQRRAQLVVQLANLLDLKRDRILRAVRELDHD